MKKVDEAESKLFISKAFLDVYNKDKKERKKRKKPIVSKFDNKPFLLVKLPKGKRNEIISKMV